MPRDGILSIQWSSPGIPRVLQFQWKLLAKLYSGFDSARTIIIIESSYNNYKGGILAAEWKFVVSSVIRISILGTNGEWQLNVCSVLIQLIFVRKSVFNYTSGNIIAI